MEVETEVRKSRIPGAQLGLFAAQFVPKGTRIGEYMGKRYKRCPDNAYVFTVVLPHGKFEYIDGTQGGSDLRRVNGCHPAFPQQRKLLNVESYQYARKIFFRTTRDVRKGEEFIVDYMGDYWNNQ